MNRPPRKLAFGRLAGRAFVRRGGAYAAYTEEVCKYAPTKHGGSPASQDAGMQFPRRSNKLFAAPRCKKGMTLTELIVSMLVFVIILGSVTVVTARVLHTYNQANNLAEANTLLDNIAALILNDIADATQIPEGVITPPFTITTTRNIIYKFGAGGILVREDAHFEAREPLPLLETEFFRHTALELEMEVNDGLVELMLRLRSAAFDGWEISRSYFARPLALN